MQGEGDRHLARVDALLQFGQAANAADEIDALVAAQIGNAQQGAQQVIRKQRYVEAFHRIVGNHFRLDAQPAPASGEIHAELAGAGRMHTPGAVLDREGGGEACHQRRLVEAVKVLDHAVVVEDFHLVVGEDHRQERFRGLLLSLLPACGGNARGGGRTMVAVGDVERLHGVEGLGDRLDLRGVGQDPDLMADAVVGGDVGCGSALRNGGDLRIGGG